MTFSNRNNPNLNVPTVDEQNLYVNRRDYSSGINTAQHASHIGETQATVLKNVDLTIPGERRKRLGNVLIANDVGDNPVLATHNFEVGGGTDQMLMYTGDKLYKWTGTSNWTNISSQASFSSLMSGANNVGFVSVKEKTESPDDVVLFYNGVNNVLRITSAGLYQDLGNGNTSPPLTNVLAWYGNRVWGLKNDQLYYSDAYDDDYSTSFDRTSNWYRIPVGSEMALVPTRDMGLVAFGKKSIVSLYPSVVPAATDQYQVIEADIGCIARKSVVPIADDIYWLAQDGVRALKRTEQDKLQMHSTLPVSFPNKDEFDIISWAYINKACAVYFDNKYLLSLPVNSSTTNNRTWVYYPATNGWSTITGWNVADWVKYKINGKEELYYGDANDSRVYKAFSTYDDNGVYIPYVEEGREEDFGQPLVDKIGGVLEVEALGVGGDYTLTVYASVDNGTYIQLGTMALFSEDAPNLPISLPFNLGGDVLSRHKFHLDTFGSFRTIKTKITNNDDNTGLIKIIGHSITTFPEEYRNENRT
jgi:hypothetical protein